MKKKSKKKITDAVDVTPSNVLVLRGKGWRTGNLEVKNVTEERLFINMNGDFGTNFRLNYPNEITYKVEQLRPISTAWNRTKFSLSLVKGPILASLLQMAIWTVKGVTSSKFFGQMIFTPDFTFLRLKSTIRLKLATRLNKLIWWVNLEKLDNWISGTICLGKSSRLGNHHPAAIYSMFFLYFCSFELTFFCILCFIFIFRFYIH